MISVIIPVHNGLNTIKKCIESILVSTFCDFEIIAVDDGSTDGTEKVLEDIAKEDDRVKVVHKINGGSASARNMGIEKAKGEYIMFVDADDFVNKKYLEEMHLSIDEKGLDLVECGFYVVDGKSALFGSGCVNDGSINIIDGGEKLNEFCDNDTYLKSVVLWNKIYKKELFNDVKFVEGKPIDDEYVIYKIFYKAKKIGILNKCLYNYCIDNVSQMRGAPSLKKLDCIDAIEAQLKFFSGKGLKRIEEKIRFRYYRVIIDNINYVKKYFPDETQVIKDLIEKRKGWYKALSCKDKSVKEKAYMVLTRYMPNIAYYVRDRIKGKNDIIRERDGA